MLGGIRSAMTSRTDVCLTIDSPKSSVKAFTKNVPSCSSGGSSSPDPLRYGRRSQGGIDAQHERHRVAGNQPDDKERDDKHPDQDRDAVEEAFTEVPSHPLPETPPRLDEAAAAPSVGCRYPLPVEPDVLEIPPGVRKRLSPRRRRVPP